MGKGRRDEVAERLSKEMEALELRARELERALGASNQEAARLREDLAVRAGKNLKNIFMNMKYVDRFCYGF